MFNTSKVEYEDALKKSGYNVDLKYTNRTPRWNLPCRGEGAYSSRSSNQSVSTRRAQLSAAAKAVSQQMLRPSGQQIITRMG